MMSNFALRTRQRSTFSLFAVALTLMVFPLAAPLPARAATGPVQQPGASSVTADALPTAQVDGVVWTQVLVGKKVFAGGQFSFVRPAGAAVGKSKSKRYNLMSYDITTGKATSFAPTFDGAVRALAVSSDKKTLYVGGSFTKVDGAVRSRFAAFTIATGKLTASHPSVGTTVNALAVIDDVVYLGGDFNKINGVERHRLAAVDADTGELLSWDPEADDGVRALVATPDGSGVVAGGSFAHLNEDDPASGMGLLDAETGESLPWAVNRVVRNAGPNAAIYSLTADDDTVYGSGFGYGGGNFEGVFAASPRSGRIKWLQDCHGDTYSIAPIGSVVYSVGHAHFCKNIGGFPDTKPRTDYHFALAATKEATGEVAKNGQPGAHYGNFEGEDAPSLLNWFPTLTNGTVTGQNQAAWSVVGNSDYVALGGEFPKVNGKAQAGLVRFARRSLAPKKQGPRVFGEETAPTAVPKRSSVQLSWKANWDRDDQSLSYDILRNNVLVKTVTRVSQFWNRPTITYSDQSGTPRARYSYSIRVRDPDGNSYTSPSVSAVYPSDAAYAQEVAADDASHQWRLGSGPGQTSAPDAVGRLPMTVKPGVTLGAPGALSADADTAASFAGTGTTSTAQTASTSSPAGPLSIEGWFKTTGHASGSLVGFGLRDQSAPTTLGSRQLYLTATGRLAFAERPSADRTSLSVVSKAAYNDDAWHHVVAVRTASTVELYVDGSRVASLASSAVVPTSTGVWTLGGVSAAGLPGASTDTFQGSLDDVAVFPTALTLRQVRDHYLAARPGLAVVDANTSRR